MIKSIVMLALILMIGPAMCEAGNQGGFAGSFLEIPIDARATAMGGAYNAVSDDGAAMLYNPAGIQSISDRIFTSSYRAMKLDRKLGYLSFIMPTHQESSLGFSWLYAGYGDVEERDISGRITGTSISANEHDFGISFAKRFMPYLAIGARLNYYIKSMDYLDASSVGINVGGLLYIDSLFRYGSMESKPITDLTAGLVIKNLAAKYPWETEGEGLNATQEDNFPITVGVGSSFKALKRKLLVAIDAEILIKSVEWEESTETGVSTEKETYTDGYFRIGGEYNVVKELMVRAGLNNGTMTAGAGFVFEFGFGGLRFDYAFMADKADEGEDHVMTLGIRF